VDDCSTDGSTIKVLERYKGTDSRIKIVRSPTSLNISGATNLAAEFATGEFVGFVDHDDKLHPRAIETVVEAIQVNADIDFLYTDEDKIEPDGTHSEPYLKPDWSPEHLQSLMYTLHFMVVRKSLFLDLGLCRAEFDGAQDYDLALRASVKARKIVHVAKVLYHWRKMRGSAAAVSNAKTAALDAGKRALTDFIKGQSPDATVEAGLFPGSFRVRWPIDKSRPVTLLILTGAAQRSVQSRGDILLVEHTVNSIINRSTYDNFKIIVVADAELPQDCVEKFQHNEKVRFINRQRQGKFNFSEATNFGLSYVETDDVILVNDDIEVITRDWIEAMLEFSRKPEIGAVGARLLLANNNLQHAGIVLGLCGPAGHVFYNLPSWQRQYCNFSQVIRNYSAVTAAVLATRMSVIKQIGGFNPSMRTDFNDVDFCLRLRSAGFRIVYTPFSELHHFENSSLLRDESNSADKSRFLTLWGAHVQRDPYYNPSLPRDRSDCVVEHW
jgi:GT2 family glycosyltransferase